MGNTRKTILFSTLAFKCRVKIIDKTDYLQWLVSPDNSKFNIFPTGLDHLWGK